MTQPAHTPTASAAPLTLYLSGEDVIRDPETGRDAWDELSAEEQEWLARFFSGLCPESAPKAA